MYTRISLFVVACTHSSPRGGEQFEADRFTETTRKLVNELDKLKQKYDKEIEELVRRRNDLIDEVGGLVRTREQVIQETEQLNSKNAQLADLNNEITRQIQGKFKANKAALPGMTIGTTQNGGLGIQYSQMADGDGGFAYYPV